MPFCAVILLSVRLAVIAFSSVSISVPDRAPILHRFSLADPPFSPECCGGFARSGRVPFSRSLCLRFNERLSFCDEAGGQNESAHRKIFSMRSDHRFGDIRQLHEELVLRAVFL